MREKNKKVKDAADVWPKLKERFRELVNEIKDKPIKGGIIKISVEQIDETTVRLIVFDKPVEMSLSIGYSNDERVIGRMSFERILRPNTYALLGNIYFDMDGDIFKQPDDLTEFHKIISLFRIEDIVVELVDQILIQSSSIKKGGAMKIKASGSVFTTECEIKSPQCEAKEPKPLEPVYTVPGNKQINVCKTCKEYMIRKKNWVLVE